jgi:hypothetical protein
MEVPAIVSEAEFEAVQRSLKARSPERGTVTISP